MGMILFRWHIRVRYNSREVDDLYLVWTENRTPIGSGRIPAFPSS